MFICSNTPQVFANILIKYVLKDSVWMPDEMDLGYWIKPRSSRCRTASGPARLDCTRMRGLGVGMRCCSFFSRVEHKHRHRTN
jgi:hypothetical protein